MKLPLKLKKKKLRKYTAYHNQRIDSGIMLLLPIFVASEANSREHWHESAKRHYNQKDWVQFALLHEEIELPCRVKMTRLAPSRLDSDNLITSFKYIRDYIAAEITKDRRPGRADSTPKIKWSYSQEKSSLYGAKIVILSAQADFDVNNQSDLEV